MQNKIDHNLNQISALISSSSSNNQQQNYTPINDNNNNNLSSHNCQDQINHSGHTNQIMQQHFNNYQDAQQSFHYCVLHHNQEHQHDSYMHLQPSNQNLIHKQQHYCNHHHYNHHHYNHHQQQQHTNARLKQIASYAQQHQQDYFKNQQQSNDLTATRLIIKQESLFSESNQNFRPRVASVSSSSSPDSPSPRYFIRSTSFSSLGNQQRPLMIENKVASVINSNLQPNSINTSPDQIMLYEDQSAKWNQHQYQQQAKDNPFNPLNAQTSSNLSTSPQQQQQQMDYAVLSGSHGVNSCSSTTPSSVTTHATSTSMSPSDALNLGINLEQYISKRNERERSRVRNVNDAFDNLKNSLPLDIEKMSKRMSKVEILRTAIGYIKNLEEVLGYKQQQQQNDSSEKQQQQDRINHSKPSGLLSNNNTIMSHQQQQESMNELSSLLRLAVTQSTTPPNSSNSQSTSPTITTAKSTNPTTSNVCLPFYRNQQPTALPSSSSSLAEIAPTTTELNITTNNNDSVCQQEVYATANTITTKLTNGNDELHYDRQQEERLHFANQDQNSSTYYTNRITTEFLSQQDRSFIFQDYQQQPVECENNQYQQELEVENQQQQQTDLMNHYVGESFDQLDG